MRHSRKLKRMGEHLRSLRGMLKYYDQGLITAGWLTVQTRGNPVWLLGRFELLLHIERTKKNMQKVIKSKK